MADKVDQMAARLERSRGWVIRQALSAWLAQEEERNRLTLEALDDVTSGQVIDHFGLNFIFFYFHQSIVFLFGFWQTRGS